MQYYTAEAAINIYPSSSSYLFHSTELVSEGQRDGEETQREEEGEEEVIEMKEKKIEMVRQEEKKILFYTGGKRERVMELKKMRLLEKIQKNVKRNVMTCFFSPFVFETSVWTKQAI